MCLNFNFQVQQDLRYHSQMCVKIQLQVFIFIIPSPIDSSLVYFYFVFLFIYFYLFLEKKRQLKLSIQGTSGPVFGFNSPIPSLQEIKYDYFFVLIDYVDITKLFFMSNIDPYLIQFLMKILLINSCQLKIMSKKYF